MHPIGGSRPEPTPESTDADIEVVDPVLAWRETRFLRMGFSPYQARVLTLDRQVDKEYVQNHLLNRGCSTDLAFDIVRT